MITEAHQSHGGHNDWLLLSVYVHCQPDSMSQVGSERQLSKRYPQAPRQYVTNQT